MRKGWITARGTKIKRLEMIFRTWAKTCKDEQVLIGSAAALGAASQTQIQAMLRNQPDAYLSRAANHIDEVSLWK